MANTIIQIKRSSSTPTPAGGSLSPAELAYSYNSEKLFLGSANGLDVIAIGGKFFTDLGVYGADKANDAFTQANSAYDVANAAYNEANTGGTIAYVNTVFDVANSAWSTANDAYSDANAAFSQANLAYGVANGALQTTGGTVTGQLNITGNLVVSGTTTYANIQHLLVSNNFITLNSNLSNTAGPLSLNSGFTVNRGTIANTYLVWDEALTSWAFSNDGTNFLKIASNTDVENVAAGANTYAEGNAATAFASAIGYANSNAAAAYASAVSTSLTYANSNAATAFASALGYANGNAATALATALGYANTVGSASNTYAQNASHINTGTLAVNYGGTGVNSLTANAVLIGNGTGGLQVTNVGTDGQVLQVAGSGVPQFAMLDGGSF